LAREMVFRSQAKKRKTVVRGHGKCICPAAGLVEVVFALVLLSVGFFLRCQVFPETVPSPTIIAFHFGVIYHSSAADERVFKADGIRRLGKRCLEW
jgi:hypothetical protein